MGEWKRGICDIHSCGYCCFAGFCPCFAVFSVVKDASGKGSDNPLDGHNPIECCVGSVICFCCLPSIFVTMVRSLVRTDRGIDGSCCVDCLTAHFCCPCALAQEHYEYHD